MTAETDPVKKLLLEKIKDAPFDFAPDRKRVEVVLRGLAKRKETKGDYYCPCRVVSGDPEEDRKIVCPCVYMGDDIARSGICLCGLFVKK